MPIPRKGRVLSRNTSILYSESSPTLSVLLALDHSHAQADREEAKELSSQLASGLCSLAELHMASPDREVDDIARQCEPLLEQARQADATSPEPIQVIPHRLKLTTTNSLTGTDTAVNCQ